MNKLRAFALDDEKHALDLLELYAKKSDLVELAATSTDPWEGKEILEREDFDVLFLDIQMPELTGLQLLDVLSKKVKVIFTSAYPEYALEGYRYRAIDYLLKPFSFERFEEALKRLNDADAAGVISNPQGHLMLKGDGKGSFIKLDLKKLIYIEGMSNYAAFHTKEERVVSLITLSEVNGLLPDSFMRVHRSYIVDLTQVERIAGNVLYIQGKDIPIGKTYRKEVFKALGI